MTRFDSKRGLYCLGVAVAAMLVVACSKTPAPPVESAQPQAQSQPQSQAAPPPAVQSSQSAALLATPASQNCLAKEGRLSIDVDPNGRQYAVCHFEDNYQCEAEALLRNNCPVSGIRVTGAVTAAQRFCMITGGLYEPAGDGTTDGKNQCRLPDGQACEADAYYQGACAVSGGI